MLTLLPLVIAVTLLTGFAAWVYLQAPGRYWVKTLLIPLSMLVWFAIVGLANTLLGYAYPAQLPDRFVLLSYNIVVENNTKVAIEVWTDGHHSRLYSVPYTKPLDDALASASRKGKDGGRVEMKRTARNGHGGGAVKADEDTYESSLRLPSDDNPKDKGP